ncbi:MAG: tetratricopeptide repeat protein [Anaerolineae bacterium]
MATEFPFFVDRQEELGVIRQAVSAVGKPQAVLIDGPGGIGKTRLLQKVQEDYGSASSLVVSEMLDLYEPELRIPARWEHRVAGQIKESTVAFADFWVQYRDSLELESRGVSAETLARARDRVNEAFIQGFNRVAAEKRIMLLLDTLEETQNVGALWPHLLGLMGRLDNVVWIVAGRQCDEVRSDVERKLGTQNVHWLPLKAFDQGAADAYFDEYFKTPSIVSLDPEMREKIRLLTGGSPILIALAITWLENELPLPELEETSVDELKDMEGAEEFDALKEKVKQALVKRLLTFGDAVDNVVLNMAWVERRFNADILNYLMGISEADVLKKLEHLPFVKIRPGENYVLHDEMRDMTVKYVWPTVDLDGTLRKRIDQKTASYYVQKTEELDARINALKQEQKQAIESGDTQAELQAFEKLSEGNRQRDVLETEKLFYTLRADLENGIEQFIRAYEWATANYRISFRSMLWEEMQHFEARFGETKDFRVGIRGARHLLEAGNAASANEKGLEVLEYATADEERIEALGHLGNCALRLGQPIEARDFYAQARKLCEEQDVHGWVSQVENGLGLAYRSSGDWDKAAEHYRESVSACERFGCPPHHLASALNNYGYVLGLRGRFEVAITLCEQALTLRQDLNLLRAVGSSYSTLGELYRYQQRYDRAFEYYNRALRIFEEQNDWEWLAIVYQEQAIAQAYAGELDEAWTNIHKALELCERYNIRALPWALNRAGRIALMRGEYNQSEQFLRRGVREARDAGDVWFLLATTVELMESRYARYQEKRDLDITDLRGEFRELVATIEAYEREEYGFPDLFGRTRRILGHVEYDVANFDPALEYYKEAYSRIASGYYGSHGLHKFPEELEELGRRVDALPPEEAIRWCDELRGSWTEEREFASLIGFCAMHKHKAQQRRQAEAA